MHILRDLGAHISRAPVADFRVNLLVTNLAVDQMKHRPRWTQCCIERLYSGVRSIAPRSVTL